MGLFDTIKTRVKKGTDTVIDTTAKVGNFMEEKSTTLIEKVPGGHDLKEKASVYTEKTVNRIGEETKEMIKEGHEFIDSHMKKPDSHASETHVDTSATSTPTDGNVQAVTEPTINNKEDTKAIETETIEKVEEHTHKKVVEKKAHTTKKAHPHTKK